MADALHNQIASALATSATSVVGGTATITTMRGSSPTPLSTLPAAPWTVIGPPKGQITPAMEEVLHITFPMRIYTGKLASDDRTQHDTNEWLDAFLLAYRTGITLGGIVSEATIRTWNTDVFYEINGEPYQAVDFTVEVWTTRATTYTA